MSFFASLLGNAALSAEKVLGDQINQNQALEQQTHADKLATERARTVAVMQQEMDEQKRQGLMARTSQQMQEAEAGGAEIGKSRRAQELLAAGAGNPSTITPEQAAVLQGAGRIKGDTPLTGIDDQLTAARKGGLYEAEAQLQTARKETVMSMKAEWDRAHRERQDDARDRMAGAAETRAQAAERRAIQGGAGAGGGNTTFDRQVALLRQAGRTDAQIADFITNKKMPTEAEIINGLMKADPNKGGKRAMTIDQAKAMAQGILGSPVAGEAAPAPAAPKPAKPSGESRISQFKVIR
jgi:hypothetical protein